MSQDQLEIERTVQSIVPFIRYHLIDMASKKFLRPIDDFTVTASQTTIKKGASGQVLISNIYFRTEYGDMVVPIALKYFNKTDNAYIEMKNALNLDIRFKTSPEFGVPRIIFASTKNPTMIIYEGIDGINYDEIEVEGKSRLAGRLLATIHGSNARSVDTTTYRDLARVLGNYLSSTGMERDISLGLGKFYPRIENALSGCNPFSDFHQSNVMIQVLDDTISRIFVIDPEFMQKGNFDRMEDMGTFFGFQIYNDYLSTGNIKKSIREVSEFLIGYQEKNIENRGLSWNDMYPNGCPLAFFIAQWALMDSLDIAMNRGGDLNSQEVISRLNFVKFILDQDYFNFPPK